MSNELPPKGDPSTPAASESAALTTGTTPTIPHNHDDSPLVNPGNDSGPSHEWIGSYRLLELLGQGGMGAVWLAEQRKPIFRKVAIKTVKHEFFEQDKAREILARFDSERQVLAIMDHPNIAKIYDAGDSQSHGPYFVMEYCPGKDLIHFCNSEKLGLTERLKLVIQLCEALEHAHQKGIIHRDLKPKNVLVIGQQADCIVKVIDFGLAKAMQSTFRLSALTVHTQAGEILGTLKYMSPEQAGFDTQDIDTRSDVYSIGVLLYELLTGHTPVETQDIKVQFLHDVAKLVRENEPPRPSVFILKQAAQKHSSKAPEVGKSQAIHLSFLTALRDEIDWIVMKSLEKDRKRRYQTVSALKSDIENYLSFSPVEARPPSRAYRLRKFTSRNKGLVTTASLILITLVISLVAVSSAWFDSTQARTALTYANSALSETNAKLNASKTQLEDAVKYIAQTNIQLEERKEELAKRNAELVLQEKQREQQIIQASEKNLANAIHSWGNGDLRTAVKDACQALDLNPLNHRALTWLYFFLTDRPNFYWEIPDIVLGGSEQIISTLVSRDGSVTAIQTDNQTVILDTAKKLLGRHEDIQSSALQIEIPGLSKIHDIFVNRSEKSIHLLAEVYDARQSKGNIEVWSYDHNTQNTEQLCVFKPAWKFFVPPFFSPNGTYFVARGGIDLDNPLQLNYALVNSANGYVLTQFENISDSRSFAISSDGLRVLAISDGEVILFHTDLGVDLPIRNAHSGISDVGFELFGETVLNGSESYIACDTITEQQVYLYNHQVKAKDSDDSILEQREGIRNVQRNIFLTKLMQSAIVDFNSLERPYFIEGDLKYYIDDDGQIDSSVGITVNRDPVRSLSDLATMTNYPYANRTNSTSIIERNGRKFVNSRLPSGSLLYEIPRCDGGYARASYTPRVTTRLPSSHFTEIHWDRRFEQVFDESNDLFVIPRSLSEIHFFFAGSCLPNWEQAIHEVPLWSTVRAKCRASGPRMWFAEVLDNTCVELSYNLIQISGNGQQELRKISLADGMRMPGEFLIAANSRKLITSTHRPVLEPFACVSCATEVSASSIQNSGSTESVLDVRPMPADGNEPSVDASNSASNGKSAEAGEVSESSQELFVINDLDTGESLAGTFEGIVCGVDEYASRLLVRFDSKLRLFDLLKMGWSSEIHLQDSLITAGAISNDGAFIFAGTEDGGFHMFDSTTLRKLKTHQYSSKINFIELSPDNTIAVVTLDMSLPLQNAQMRLEKAVKTVVIDLQTESIICQLPATSKFYDFSNDGRYVLIAEKSSVGYQFTVLEASTGSVKFGPITTPGSGEGIFGEFISDDVFSLTSGGRTQFFSTSKAVPITKAFFHPDLSGRQSFYSNGISETAGVLSEDHIVLAFGTTPGQRSYVVKLPIIRVKEEDLAEVKAVNNWAKTYVCTELQSHGVLDHGPYFSERYLKLRQRLNSEKWEQLRNWLAPANNLEESLSDSQQEIAVEPFLEGYPQFVSPHSLSR